MGLGEGSSGTRSDILVHNQNMTAAEHQKSFLPKHTPLARPLLLSLAGSLAIAACAPFTTGATVPAPTQSESTLTPTSAQNVAYSPSFEVTQAIRQNDSVTITVCFNLPDADKDWVLGRLAGDVLLSDGRDQIALDSFTLVSLDQKSAPPPIRRCDLFTADVPASFSLSEARLEVKRIAASMPQSIDWDIVTQRVQHIAPGLEFAPLPDQSGPSIEVIQTPPGMTAEEASNLVVGLVDPVILGPWDVPVHFSP